MPFHRGASEGDSFWKIRLGSFLRRRAKPAMGTGIDQKGATSRGEIFQGVVRMERAIGASDGRLVRISLNRFRPLGYIRLVGEGQGGKDGSERPERAETDGERPAVWGREGGKQGADDGDGGGGSADSAGRRF
jgi:hypothetical protein